MKKKLKYLGICLLVLLFVIQFFHPQKNMSNDMSNDISKKFPMPDTIRQILKVSCNDCHSNLTVYPWYSKIQPIDWWLQNHVDEGKRELNFNEFSAYRTFRQYHKLEKIKKEVEEDGMPLSSFTLIHGGAKLSDGQKEFLKNWANSLHDTLKAKYPPDSLVNPNRKKRN